MRMRESCVLVVLTIALSAWMLAFTSVAPDVLAAAPPDAPSPVVKRGLPYYTSAEFTPQWTADRVHRVAPFNLVDQRGKKFTERDLDGRISIVGFFYASCSGVCPRTAGNLLPLQQRFARDPRVQIVSHSVTGDSRHALAEYAKAQSVDAQKWHLLTGDADVIGELCCSSYFSAPRAAPQARREALHTENLLLIDSSRRIRGLYRGTLRLEVERLMNDVTRLEMEQ